MQGVRNTVVFLLAQTVAVLGQGVVEFSAPTFFAQAMDHYVTITVTNVGAPNGPLSVDFTMADVTAMAGRDYVSQSGTLKFTWLNVWDTQERFTIPLLEDT